MALMLSSHDLEFDVRQPMGSETASKIFSLKEMGQRLSCCSDHKLALEVCDFLRLPGVFSLGGSQSHAQHTSPCIDGTAAG